MPKGAMTLWVSPFGECAHPCMESWADAVDVVKALSAAAVVQAVTARIFFVMCCPLVVPGARSLFVPGARSLFAPTSSRRTAPFDGRDGL